MNEDTGNTDNNAENDTVADATIHDFVDLQKGAESKEALEVEPEVDTDTIIVNLNDRLLRSVAELENFRRRAEKERQDTAKFATTNFARDCLPVLDNLRRGLDSVTTEARAENTELETLAAGMELTERDLIATFERHGISKIDPMGEIFNYDMHQAMFEVPDPTKPTGSIVQVVQPGYMLNGRLLRPAMVGVAKGGAAPGPVQAPIANEEVSNNTIKKQNAVPGEASKMDGDGSVDTSA